MDEQRHARIDEPNVKVIEEVFSCHLSGILRVYPPASLAAKDSVQRRG